MIEVDRLNLTVGDRRRRSRSFSLRDVTFSVPRSEYFVLLGKSGSGKTLLLETICGLNRTNSGQIRIGGSDVTNLEPRRRGIGYLPQDYALFPHRTVYGNVAYGLFGRGLTGEAKLDITRKMLAEMGIEHLAARYPGRLSGGEKQRVALARALAVQPRLLLLDEPVSALDEQTRDALCRRLKQFQQRHGTTTLHVCHNFNEMLQVADRVAVMVDGQVAQTGTPQEILERPVNLDVAALTQPGNLFVKDVVVDERSDGVWLSLPGNVEIAVAAHRGLHGNRPLAVMIREENIRVLSEVPKQRDPKSSVVTARVTDVTDLGSLVRLTTRVNERVPLVVTQSKGEFKSLGLSVDVFVQLSIHADDVHLIPIVEKNAQSLADGYPAK